MRPLIYVGLLTLALLCIEQSAAQAATWYVDQGCGDISTYNPGAAPGSRCTGGSSVSRTSLTTVMTAMAGGDVVYIRAGTYGKLNAPKSGGGASSRTVFSAYPINRTCSGHNPADVRTCCGSTYEPVIFGPNTSGATINIRGAGAVPGPKVDRSWITVEGIIVDSAGAGDNGITITGGGTRPDNEPACDANANGPASHGYDTTPDHLRFMNMVVKNAGNQGFLGEDYNEFIEIICSHFHDNGNTVNTDHGIYLGGSNNWVYGNLIERNRRYGIHYYAQPEGTFANPGCDPFGTGTVIEHNILRNNNAGILLGRGNRNATVRNNLIYGNTTEGLQNVNSFDGVHKIYNNTIVENGGFGLWLGEFADNLLIINNIYDGLSQHAAVVGTNTFTTNYNITSTSPSPNFVDAGAHDYRLRAGDARINGGTNLTSEGVTVDFDGNARTVGAFDIGAYEFNASGPPTQTFDFSMANEGAQTVAQGASVENTITLTTEAGTATTVTLTAEGLPSNATASFAAASCIPNCTSNLTIDTANTTPEGTYLITVRGSTGVGAGNIQRVSTFNLIVSCN